MQCVEFEGNEVRIELVFGTIRAIGTTMLLMACRSRTNRHSSGWLGFGIGKMGVLHALVDEINSVHIETLNTDMNINEHCSSIKCLHTPTSVVVI